MHRARTLTALLALAGLSSVIATAEPTACDYLCRRLRQLQAWYGDKLLVNTGKRLSAAEMDALRKLGARSRSFWGPTPLIAPEGKLSVDYGGSMPDGISCRGLLYEAGAGRQVTSPGDGFMRVGHERGRSSVVIRTDAPLEVTMSGFFEIEVREGDFILSAEPLGNVPFRCAHLHLPRNSKVRRHPPRSARVDAPALIGGRGMPLEVSFEERSSGVRWQSDLRS